MMEEEWKVIEDSPNYEVSSNGSLRKRWRQKMIPKFRIWDDENKVMWNVERWHIEDEYFDLIEPNKSVVDLNAKRTWRKQKDVILMQSTGLFDKNGQEVFEGDVVRMSSGELLPVKLHHGMFEPVCYYISNAFERVGNVFENPELLEHPDFREANND